ncbi:MAG: type IV secretion system DNA-binding domain-containing protein [Pseudomonadota bacterium]
MRIIPQTRHHLLGDDELVLGTVAGDVLDQAEREATTDPDNSSIPRRTDAPLVRTPLVARQRHMHIIGSNGSGKSRFMRSLIQQDIRDGRGVCVIDPHGTLCADLLGWLANRPRLAKHRKVRYFDVGKGDNVLAFNPLQTDHPLSAHATAIRVADAIGRLFSDDELRHQPRTMEVLVALLISLVEARRPLADYPLFMNPRYRFNVAHIIDGLHNDATREQWRFLEKYKDNEFIEYVSSVSRRLYTLMANPIISAIFSQTEQTMDLRQAMDGGEILLFNLADTALFDATSAQLFGLLLISTLFADCKLRNTTRPFFLYLDEAHRFLGGGDIAKMFEEARKFGLHLVLAHQNLGQLRDAGERIFATVMNEAEIKTVFKIQEPEDAQYLVQLMFRNGLIDPGRVKDVLTKPTVVGYSIGTLNAWMNSQSEVKGSGTNSISGGAISMLPDGDFLTGPTTVGQVQSNADTKLDSVAKGSASAKTSAESLMPILEDRPSGTWPIEEQVFMLADDISSLERQHGVVSVGGSLSVKFRALDVPDEFTSTAKRAAYLTQIHNDNPYLQPFKTHRLNIPDEQPKPPVVEPDDFLE